MVRYRIIILIQSITQKERDFEQNVCAFYSKSPFLRLKQKNCAKKIIVSFSQKPPMRPAKAGRF